jgi:hypothetical protein
MTNSELYVKMQVVEIAWKYASHFGGAEHMLGVMHVIKNRQKSGWGTYLHILDTMDKWEASPAPTKNHPDLWNRNFLKLLNEVDGVLDDTRRDPTGSALYFGDTTTITSDWFLEHVARNPEKSRCGDINSWTYWR